MGSLVMACLLALNPSTAMVQPGALSRFTYTEYHMGVDARLVVYASGKQQAEAACAAAFERIAELDTIMSDYRPTSELMRLCARAGTGPVKVSPDLMVVLQRAQEVSELSGGAFDVTAGPLIGLWRAARKSAVLPQTADIETARSLVGWQKVELDAANSTVKLAVSGMKLDLGGIAKGYAGDEAQKVLKAHGVTCALVEMGGDIVVSGAPPGAIGWMVRVPNADGDIPFANCAVSTSGDTEQFVVIGGVQYSHVVDPRTGWALTNRTQATVVARDGLTSDPLSTVMTLLDEDKREAVLKAYPRSRAYVRVVKSA